MLFAVGLMVGMELLSLISNSYPSVLSQTGTGLLIRRLFIVFHSCHQPTATPSIGLLQNTGWIRTTINLYTIESRWLDYYKFMKRFYGNINVQLKLHVHMCRAYIFRCSQYCYHGDLTYTVTNTLISYECIMTQFQLNVL